MKLGIVLAGALLGMATTASAEFRYEEWSDDFDGSTTGAVIGDSSSMKSFALLRVNNGSSLLNNFNIAMQVGSLICSNSDDTVRARWIAYGHDGAKGEVYDEDWHVSKKKDAIVVGSLHGDAGANRFFDALVKSKEVKVRIVDECGTITDLAYDMTGFPEAVQEMEGK